MGLGQARTRLVFSQKLEQIIYLAARTRRGREGEMLLARDCSRLKNKNSDKPETILQLTSGIKLAQFLLPICIVQHTHFLEGREGGVGGYVI